MTDNEIIKALECCYTYSNCNGCPQEGKIKCLELAGRNALDLINRQKAEIERLISRVSVLAEIEKDCALKYGDDIDVSIVKKQIKAEAIKEFADRLITKIVNTPFGVNCTSETESYKEGCLHGLVAKQNSILDVIDNLSKEMTEVL